VSGGNFVVTVETIIGCEGGNYSTYYSLFNDAVSSSNYIMSSGRVASKELFGRVVQGSGRGDA